MSQRSTMISTPWRSRAELLEVRRWIYNGPLRGSGNAFASFSSQHNDLESAKWRRKACDKRRGGHSHVAEAIAYSMHLLLNGPCLICLQISAWKLRPPLPHAVESTWLIIEAILADDYERNSTNISVFSVQAGYLTALTRFVTALLDASQTSKYKVSMYTKATELGLPTMFVDLRHEATHGEMPSLTVLRDAAQKALDWLWSDYWSKLEADELSNAKGVLEGEGTPRVTPVEIRAWEPAADWQTCPIGTLDR